MEQTEKPTNFDKNQDETKNLTKTASKRIKTILVVEDTEFMLFTEVKLLEELGYENIISAVNGDEAIKKLNEMGDNIDLIISDWNMPKTNGLELLQWVKKNENYKNIPFIMATSHAEKNQLSQATEAGASNILTKPFGIKDIKESIETLFDSPKVTKSDKSLNKKTDSGKVQITVGHIPITDHLILGVLENFISTGKVKPKHFELNINRMLMWNPVQKALENGDIDAAFILAPIVMDLFNHGIDVKIVMLAHQNGSVCVRNRTYGDIDRDQESLRKFFKTKLFYLPHTLSVHHILSHMYLKGIGLNPGYVGSENADIFYEVIPPLMMPDFQTKEKYVAGFMVAEPIGAKAVFDEAGEELFLTGELWENHPCCVVAMRDGFIDKYPEATQEFVHLLVEAGQYIKNEPQAAAQIAVDFLDPNKIYGYNRVILDKVLMSPKGIKTDSLKPILEDFDKIQKYMHDEIGIGEIIDLEKLIDTRFIDNLN